ncbi:hypothetical protein K474DRAFT_1665572 [Panus rudis PR-1116 ss-1]|nr:hypothetical protein K474DRAFT_1665572 [Panus rudis PR-1116 ss-1]
MYIPYAAYSRPSPVSFLTSPPAHWDMRVNPHRAFSDVDIDYAKMTPATQPPASSIPVQVLVTTPEFVLPWSLLIKPGQRRDHYGLSNPYAMDLKDIVTIDDVLQGVYKALSQSFPEPEWSSLPSEQWRQLTYASYKARYRALPEGSQKRRREKGENVKRVDTLCGMHWFGGLMMGADGQIYLVARNL